MTAIIWGKVQGVVGGGENLFSPRNFFIFFIFFYFFNFLIFFNLFYFFILLLSPSIKIWKSAISWTSWNTVTKLGGQWAPYPTHHYSLAIIAHIDMHANYFTRHLISSNRCAYHRRAPRRLRTRRVWRSIPLNVTTPLIVETGLYSKGYPRWPLFLGEDFRCRAWRQNMKIDF